MEKENIYAKRIDQVQMSSIRVVMEKVEKLKYVDYEDYIQETYKKIDERIVMQYSFIGWLENFKK